MRNFKRIVSVFLLIAMLFLNAGCSKEEEKTEETPRVEYEVIQCEGTPHDGYDDVVRNIQRIGQGTGYPVHSLDAYREAYRMGFRIFLCDLIFTFDNVPVCSHDTYLNQYYEVFDENGELVSTDEPIRFMKTEYEQLAKYSYGEMGNPLLTFKEMLKLVRDLGVELYVEVKDMSKDQAKIACDMIRQYGLEDKTSWCGLQPQMQWVVEYMPTARVALMPMEITDAAIEKVNSLKTGQNEVFIFGWDTTELNEEIVAKLIENDIAFEMGTPGSPEAVLEYFSRGDAYYYCTGVEANGFIPGKVLQEAALGDHPSQGTKD